MVFTKETAISYNTLKRRNIILCCDYEGIRARAEPQFRVMLFAIGLDCAFFSAKLKFLSSNELSLHMFNGQSEYLFHTTSINENKYILSGDFGHEFHYMNEWNF